ncbi:MAG: CinA family protein [Alphaproteobacteria bacterium]|nr:CinA family protein [Alphaproteobacteria bacterium]
MFSRELLDRAGELLRLCDAAGLRLATAESCTGGLIAGCLTEIPGASNVLERGFVTYSNESKTALLGVPKEVIETEGAVSEAVALAMAEGAVEAAGVDLAIAVTGIAGPDGGTREKPVGLVHMAAAAKDARTLHVRQIFKGDRTEIRMKTVHAAIELLLKQAKTFKV